MSPNNVMLTLSRARRLALRAQLLDGPGRRPKGKEGVRRAVEHLGYVQIDTIAVVERAHHHTLWSRCPDYEPAMLDELHGRSRRVFEYWGHAASYLPIEDYRYYIPRMRSFPWDSWTERLYERHKEVRAAVMERVEKEGPLRAADFKAPRKKATGWWDWKPSKVALELLLWEGRLMVVERRNFQRVYDLTERVLPPDVDTNVPDGDELGRFAVRRALRAHGVASRREIYGHLHGMGRENIDGALVALQAEGEVVPIRIKELPEGEYFAAAKELGRKLGKRPPRLHILSPFDNAVIHRERVKWLFGADYVLECYVPAAKRRFGYFGHAIIWGDEFAGRLDAKAERKERRLVVKNFALEEGFGAPAEFWGALGEKLTSYASFNGCDDISVERTTPPSLAKALRKAVG